MVVMKFGGTSVGNSEIIRAVCSIIRNEKKPAAVVSAVGGVTDKLLAQAEAAVRGKQDISGIRDIHSRILTELTIEGDQTEALLAELEKVLEEIHSAGKLTDKLRDRVVSFGERISARIVAAALRKNGTDAIAVDAFDLGFLTVESAGVNEIHKDTYGNIRKKYDSTGPVSIVTGFIAKNANGDITTLGRGGSDYTASIIAAALGARELQIWTDVSGFRTVDPRIIPEAAQIDRLTFDEAAELAYFGAKILHPMTIQPAVEKKIDVRILNTHQPQNSGTQISFERKDIRKGRVKSVTAKKGIRIVTVTSTRMLNAVGFLEKLFNIFANLGIVVDMIATSEVSVSATINGTDKIKELKTSLEHFATVKVEKEKAIICAVGEGLKSNSSIVAGQIFSLLGRRGINVHMVSQGASEINISFVVDADQADKVVKYMHNDFFE